MKVLLDADVCIDLTRRRPAALQHFARRPASDYATSATVLFVLRHALDAGIEDGTPVVALAFGPGLTVESAALTAVGTTPRIAVPAVTTAADRTDVLAAATAGVS